MTDTATAAPLREIICSNCTRPTGEYSTTERHRIGKCCADIPPMWAYNAMSGQYTGTGTEDEPDTTEYELHQCQACGHSTFNVRMAQWERHEYRWTATFGADDVSSYDDSLQIDAAQREHYDGPTGRDDSTITQLECEACGAAFDGNYELS